MSRHSYCADRKHDARIPAELAAPVMMGAVAKVGLELFGIGYSWGGYESLALPFDCTAVRTATRFSPGGPTVRFSVGLEDVEDLKADLERGFARLRATLVL